MYSVLTFQKLLCYVHVCTCPHLSLECPVLNGIPNVFTHRQLIFHGILHNIAQTISTSFLIQSVFMPSSKILKLVSILLQNVYKLNNKFNKCLSYKLNFISTISFYSLQKWKHCALSRTFYYIYVMNVKKKKLCP